MCTLSNGNIPWLAYAEVSPQMLHSKSVVLRCYKGLIISLPSQLRRMAVKVAKVACRGPVGCRGESQQTCPPPVSNYYLIAQTIHPSVIVCAEGAFWLISRLRTICQNMVERKREETTRKFDWMQIHRLFHPNYFAPHVLALCAKPSRALWW